MSVIDKSNEHQDLEILHFDLKLFNITFKLDL